MIKQTLTPQFHPIVQTLSDELAELQAKADELDQIRATLMVNFGLNRQRHPDGVVVGHKCRTHDALHSALSQYHEKLKLIRTAIEAIVIPSGDDAGVLLVSSESPTTHKDGVGVVYDKEYFSDMGAALVALWKLTGGV